VDLEKRINKNQMSVNQKLKQMADSFNAKLGAVRKELAKDRAHAESRLKSSTNKVYAALFAAQEKQAVKNAKMMANIRRMRLDAMNNVRDAKREFISKIHALAKKVADNDKKADKKIDNLTGLVKKEALKSAQGRQLIAATEQRNKDELKNAIHSAIVKGEKRAQLVEARGEKMDKDTKWLVNNKLDTEITALRKSTDASVEALRLQSKEARAQQAKEMLYAIRSAASVAHDDLEIAIHNAVKTMDGLETKASHAKAFTPLEKKAFESEYHEKASQVSRMVRDAMATVAETQTCYNAETMGKIKKHDISVSAYAEAMRAQVVKTQSHMAKTISATLMQITKHEHEATKVAGKFASADAARESSALKFVKDAIKQSKEDIDKDYVAKQNKLADARADADEALAAATRKLNDALAKQAAIMDSRFSKTVANLNTARKQATSAVIHLRKDFATQLALVISEVTKIETMLIDSISVVSGEIISPSANKYRVDLRVGREINRILTLANSEYSHSKRARGQLKILMDENKAAASDEVTALSKSLKGKIAHARDRKFRSVTGLYDDLGKASKAVYENVAAQLKAGKSGTVKGPVDALYASKIVMLASAVAAGAKRAQRDMTEITGVVHNINKASLADKPLIDAQNKMAQNDMNMMLTGAIMYGEARAKAVEQRIAEHQKHTKRWLQIEVTAHVQRAAHEAFKNVEATRKTIADNYLSLKAYAVSAADKVVDQLSKGHGRYLSSVGDLLQTIGALGAVKPRPSEGLGMGGDEVYTIFSGYKMKVHSGKAPVNGLVNEFVDACKQVRNRWPMGLGKYLMDKLEESMAVKGVLEVDKVAGKSGNFVYVNSGALGLTTKMNDFSSLAVGMSDYESALAKLTSKLTVGPKTKATFYAKPPEWNGN
jgi:hypothetical protein